MSGFTPIAITLTGVEMNAPTVAIPHPEEFGRIQNLVAGPTEEYVHIRAEGEHGTFTFKVRVTDLAFVKKWKADEVPDRRVCHNTFSSAQTDHVAREGEILTAVDGAGVLSGGPCEPQDESRWSYSQLVGYLRDVEKTAFTEGAEQFFRLRSEDETELIASWTENFGDASIPDKDRARYMLETAAEPVLGVDGQGFRPGAMVTGREMQLYLGLFARLVREMAECEDREMPAGKRRAWELLRELVRVTREVKKTPSLGERASIVDRWPTEQDYLDLKKHIDALKVRTDLPRTLTGAMRSEPEMQDFPRSPRGSVRAMTETGRVSSTAPNQANPPQAIPKDPALTWELSHVGRALRVEHDSGKMYPDPDGPDGHWVVLQHRGASGRRTRAMLRADDIWFMGPEREEERAESPFMPQPEPPAEPAPEPNHAAALFEMMAERDMRGDYAGADRAWETRGCPKQPEPLEAVRDRLGEVYATLGVSTHARAMERVNELLSAERRLRRAGELAGPGGQ